MLRHGALLTDLIRDVQERLKLPVRIGPLGILLEKLEEVRRQFGHEAR